ncbi:MAG: hypothetical protein Q9168_000603 [Polycauliona sp. 1 TL-2023]
MFEVMSLIWLFSWLLFFSVLAQAIPVDQPRVATAPAVVDSDVPCTDYADCSSRGLALLNKLHTTLFQDVIVDQNKKDLFQEHYTAEFSHLQSPEEKFDLPLRNRGIDIVKMDYWAICPKNPKTGVIETPDEPPYLNMFDTKNGIIIADANDRADDTQKTLKWSELMYQTWALTNATGGPISNLRSVVQSEVVNDGSKAAFQLAYENNMLLVGGDGDGDWREWNEATHQSFFYDMLATDNVKGVVWLLIDHAEEIGKKEITNQADGEDYNRAAPKVSFVFFILATAKPSGVEGFPMRSWKISLVLLNEHDGSEMPATIFEKATYKLHPTFGDRETQVLKKAPFKISEEGWGEFDLRIIVSAIDKGGDHELSHDLNFQQERYEAEHKITFKNPKPNLLEKLKESGPVGAGGEENGVKPKRGDESAKKRKRSEKGVDMEKLAESLQRLGEEDLLQVVEMVHNNKTADTYTKNDVEQGEFHVDLYTLPDSLVRMLWDFCVEKLGS